MTRLMLLVFCTLVAAVHASAGADANDTSEAAPSLLFMEGESMSTVTSSNSTSSTVTDTKTSEVGDMMQPSEPLEVSDMNRDPYRNTTDTVAVMSPRPDRVTQLADDVTEGHNVTEGHDVTEGHNVTGSHDVTGNVGVDNSSSVSAETTTIGKAPVLVVEHGDHGHLDNGKSAPFSRPSEVAAIMAGVVVTLAVAGYGGLLAWRRFLERRYSNREMLVNEDDGDLHQFEL